MYMHELSVIKYHGMLEAFFALPQSLANQARFLAVVGHCLYSNTNYIVIQIMMHCMQLDIITHLNLSQ